MDIGLLLIRLIIGVLFIGHGTQKLFGWFGGPGIGGTAGYFQSLGYRHGRSTAILAGLTELGAGAALAAGVLTPLAAAAVMGVMINAAVAQHADMGLWVQDGGFEYPLVVAVVAIALAATGPGALSLDGVLGWQLSGVTPAVGAVLLGTLTALLALATRSRQQTTEQTR